MKTRSTVMEATNIAAIVKARHHARVICPTSGHSLGSAQSQFISGGIYEPSETSCNMSTYYNVSTTSGQAVCDDGKLSVEDKAHKSRSENTPRLLRGTWSPDDRRLFFQAVRMYGRNFNEITRFIRSRGHRTSIDHQLGSSASSEVTLNSLHSGNNLVSSINVSSVVPSNIGTQCPSNTSQPNVGSNAPCTSTSDLNAPNGGRTREQVRFFYQQTWHKVRRYIKFPEDVPQHVREVYAIVNYSVLRTRIKKPLDHRLGEKLNELVYCGTTVIKHNGRRFLLRTPVCPALKQLNSISAPSHEFLLPEDVWVELVPRTQTDAWRVIESEQNPRLRLRIDINRQLSDVILLVENKWQLAAERMRSLLGFPLVHESVVSSVMLNLCYSQAIDGAIRIQEVARIRSGDIGLRAYLDRMNTKLPKSRIQPNVCSAEKQSGAQADSVESSSLVNSNLLTSLAPSSLCISDSKNSELANSNPPVTTATSNSELDLRDLGKQLSIGVTHEMAREIKLVTIYLALGCPERIRFEYQFFCTKDKGVQKQSNTSYSDLLICPPLDPDGDGISNGLRRLLHLNASDYLLHRDWVSRHSIRSDTPVSISCHSSQATIVSTPTTATVLTQNCTSPLVPKTSTESHLPQLSSESPIFATTQQPLVVSTCISSQQPTVMMYSPSNTIQVLINGQPSMFQLNSTLSASNPIISSLLTTNSLMRPPVTPVQSPKLVLLQQPVGQKIPVPVVERQLDHERQVTTIVTMNQVPYVPLLPKQSTVPLHTSIRGSSPMTTFGSSSPISLISTNETENTSPVTSSLDSLKAFNARRRSSIVSQVNKRLTENSSLGKELRTKSSPSTSISNNLLSSCITMNSSLRIPQSTDDQTSKAINGDEASVSNIHSKSLTLSISNTDHDLWSSSKLLNNEPVIAVTSTSAVFSNNLSQVHSISSLLSSSPSVSLLQSNNATPFVTLPKSSNADINLDDLLVSSETNQSSMSSSFSNDTLASLLNTICPRYPQFSTTDNQSLLFEPSNRSAFNTLRPLVESSITDLHKTIISTPTTNDGNISLKIEETGEKSFSFRTSDSVCSYPPGSPSIGDISFTDSMAAAVMDVHHMELDHLDEDQSTDIQSEPLNRIASNLVIQPDIYPLRPPYESLMEHQDIKTSRSYIGTSEYNCITNVEVFLRMNTPKSSQSSPCLNSTMPTSTTSHN
ncbi:Protein cramped [Schistosoma japonicum]|nr:Protein cramped [Schistosoma japonicum]KAH8877087.1 Protein cramped [Schistosoma japonicum]